MGNFKNIYKKQVEWELFLSQLEPLIVLGQHEKCRELLLKINPKKIPRQWIVSFADIAWRANSFLFALKTLLPVIYPENSFFEPATAQEKVIYGSSLSSLGATHEAIKILKEIDGDEEPSALFHLASALFYEWNYEAAIPYLQKYINSTKIIPYRKIVGKVNLAAALIHIQAWPEAKKLLEEIQGECETNSYQLLLGNCIELRAQIEIFQERYDAGRELLNQAFAHLKNQAGHYSMYVEKWLAICGCLQSKNQNEKTQHLEILFKVRKQAIELKHWNTIRECDLFEAVSTGQHELFKKVIMGTPSELYRQRARKIYGSSAISKGHFYLVLGQTSTPNECLREFDPYQKTATDHALYTRPLLFCLFQALTIDFYQPQTLAMIFQKIYVNEKFNPYNSPLRVLQLLRRLNIWFVNNQQPLRVDFSKSEFQLTSIEPIRVLITRGDERTVKTAKFSELQAHFQGKKFSINEICQVLQISKPTAERLLRTAFADGIIFKERKPRGVAYRFTARNQIRKVG